VSVFMAKAPSGNVSEWDGSGPYWFKVGFLESCGDIDC